jgi:hypothetical protein
MEPLAINNSPIDNANIHYLAGQSIDHINNTEKALSG